MNHQSPVLILNDVINRDLAPTSLSPKPSTLMHASWGASTAFAKTRYRHLPLPPDHDLCAAATRTLTAFAAPHKVLEPDAAAKKLLQATCTLCNIKASLAPEEGDYDCAARWGAGPWKVGVLAGLLFGFDVFVGQIDPATVAASPRLSLQREHIRRARELRGLLEHMRAAWAVNSDAFTAPEQVLLQDPEFVAGLAPGHGRLPSQMEELPQQQQ